MEIQISINLMEQFAQGNSCDLLSQNKANKLFLFRNTRYIITGSSQIGKKGIISANAYAVRPLLHYKGEALNYQQHWNAVSSGKKPRNWTDMKFKYDGQEYVIIGEEVKFLPKEGTAKTEQITLF